MARGQAERLVPMLEEVLSDCGLAWRDLHALAVGTGPGNFTGIRISIATARGLSMSLGIPAIGVSLFDVRAWGYFEHPESADSCLVCLPGPRDQTFIQLQRRDGAKDLPRLITAAAPELTDAERGATAIGPSCKSLEQFVQTDGRWNSSRRSTARMAGLAKRRLQLDEPIEAPVPLYVTPPDAAPPADRPPAIVP